MFLHVAATGWHYETANGKYSTAQQSGWGWGGGGKVAAHTPHSDTAIIY